MPRPLRADAERTVRAILEAADRVLSENPAATLQQVADVAGVARTTVHRRFATREALVDAMITAMLDQLEEAIDAGRPETAPPLVALHQVSANVIRVKSGWRFTSNQLAITNPATQDVLARIRTKSELLFQRLAGAGVLADRVEQDWVVRIYHALLHEAIVRHADTGEDADGLAEKVVSTLLWGLGANPA